MVEQPQNPFPIPLARNTLELKLLYFTIVNRSAPRKSEVARR
jgi:hypothetical protein